MAKSLAQQLKEYNNKLDKYGNYKYTDKGLKKAYTEAQNAYNYMLSDKGKKKYGFDKYINNVNDLYNRIMNSPEFSYDMEQDQLFQMYKQQYDKQGRQAMQNAMGVGVARSGGYNSSAAQTAAQTQYLGYMDALNEKAIDTYQAALGRYEKNQQDLQNQYNLTRDMNNAANEAYWNQVNLASQKLTNAYNIWNADDERQYNKWQDQRNFLFNRSQSIQNQINWKKQYGK